MGIDVHSRGAALKRAILSDVREMTVGLMSGISNTIAAQNDGTVVSDGHRVLNFTGLGVSVLDDPASRRVNINIPGGAAGSAAATVVSTAGAGKVFLLGTPPANWWLPGFNDSAWPTVIAESPQESTVPGWSAPAGTTWITNLTGNQGNTDVILHRLTFTLPSGAISAATLDLNGDNEVSNVWINGNVISGFTLTGSLPRAYQSQGIPTSFLISGGSNVLAVQTNNVGPVVGANLLALVYRLTVNSAVSGVGAPYVSVQEQFALGTNGGTFTSGSFVTRTLNTIVSDPSGMATLASGQVTLPAGSYQCNISAPAFFVDQHQTRLQNITAGTTLLTGSSEESPTTLSRGVVTRSFITGRFTLSATSALAIQHRCATTRTTDGLGRPDSFGTEVYTMAVFVKEP